jgi:hypothetical protein
MSQTFYHQLSYSVKNGESAQNSLATASQICHLLKFRFQRPTTKLDTAMLIISVDVDAGTNKLGLINKGKNDLNVNNYLSESKIGEAESKALPQLVKAFDCFGVPVTFALRGQLIETGDPIIDTLLGASVKHDIGAHGYTHRTFTTLTKEEAVEELKLTANQLKKVGVTPHSFVFPRNAVAHLDVLESFNYKCYRANAGSFRKDDMLIQRNGGLYNIQPSLYLCPTTSPLLAKKILNFAVNEHAPLHVWFHPWNLGLTEKSITQNVQKFILPFLKHAKLLEYNGLLRFETMFSAAETFSQQY